MLTSTNEIDKVVREVEVYPVPSSNEIYLAGIDEPIRHIAIYNHFGSLVKTIKGGQSITINELSSGIYWVKVELKKGEVRMARVVRR